MSEQLNSAGPAVGGRAHRVLLPVLLLVSGFCGISYEILYTKLLGNLLGSQFTINATVLLTFLLGIGLGTLLAHRLVRWLWAVEAGIGLYAAIMVVAYDAIDRLIFAALPWLGTSVLTCAMVAVALLAVPAFLVGCSIPLFAAYLSTLRSLHVFSLTYGIYNIGAALTALSMEFVLLRAVGLRSATLMLAGLNAVVAVGLLLLVRTAPLVPPPRLDRLRFLPRDLTALVLASVASAIFQLMMIRIAECVIGPFNETFALVLTVVLVGLSVGSLVAGRLRLTLAGALMIALSGLLLLLALHSTIVGLYPEIRIRVVDSYPLLVLLKLGMVVALMGIPAVGFGATIPALLQAHRDVAREAGWLLFLSSMGNVTGFVLMAFVLHQYLEYGSLLLVTVALTLIALLIHTGTRRVAVAGVVVGAAALVAWAGAWHERTLYYGHEYFLRPEFLELAEESQFSAQKFKGREDVFAITYRNGEPSFFINGYNSIPLTAVAEKVAGALSVMMAPRTDEALVLGIGSGATAGTVGLFFDHTEAVEINEVILEHLDLMSQYNFDLEAMPQVTIVHDDGIHYIKAQQKRYPLIVNTVTTPLYFSSSKLYTRDFLDLVLARLAPDGVYTTWVDQDLGDRGVDIVLETLDEAFEECWLGFLKSSYYLLMCSNAELRPHQLQSVVGNTELGSYLIEFNELVPRLLPYSVISTSALEIERRGRVPTNTLDLPVLEHEMARLSRGKISDFNRRLEESLQLWDVRRAFEGAMSWHPGEFLLWQDLRTRDSATLSRMLEEVVPRQFGDVSAAYDLAALETAEEIGTVDAFETYGQGLYRRDSYNAAIRAYKRLLELAPDDARAHYYLGRANEKLGNDQTALEHFRETLRLDPDYERASEAIDRLGG